MPLSKIFFIIFLQLSLFSAEMEKPNPTREELYQQINWENIKPITLSEKNKKIFNNLFSIDTIFLKDAPNKNILCDNLLFFKLLKLLPKATYRFFFIFYFNVKTIDDFLDKLSHFFDLSFLDLKDEKIKSVIIMKFITQQIEFDYKITLNAKDSELSDDDEKSNNNNNDKIKKMSIKIFTDKTLKELIPIFTNALNDYFDNNINNLKTYLKNLNNAKKYNLEENTSINNEVSLLILKKYNYSVKQFLEKEKNQNPPSSNFIKKNDEKTNTNDHKIIEPKNPQKDSSSPSFIKTHWKKIILGGALGGLLIKYREPVKEFIKNLLKK